VNNVIEVARAGMIGTHRSNFFLFYIRITANGRSDDSHGGVLRQERTLASGFALIAGAWQIYIRYEDSEPSFM
jgi:hypothetical protein